jgi:hypothetical protein
VTNVERFEEAKRIWSETLKPETPAEQRLVSFIACQDRLLARTFMSATETDSPQKAVQQGRCAKELAASIESMIAAVTVLQQRRMDAGSPTPPPPSPATRAAKVLTMPKRAAAVARPGRQPASQLDPEAVPSLRPFGSARTADPKEPSVRTSLDLRRVA